MKDAVLFPIGVKVETKEVAKLMVSEKLKYVILQKLDKDVERFSASHE